MPEIEEGVSGGVVTYANDREGGRVQGLGLSRAVNHTPGCCLTDGEHRRLDSASISTSIGDALHGMR